MSTLDERLRALRQGRELLEAVAQELRLSQDLRDAALAELHAYPTASDIGQMLESESQEQRLAWGCPLARTRNMLDALVEILPSDDQISRWARGVERHFPEASYLPGAGGNAGQWSAVFLDPWKALRKAG